MGALLYIGANTSCCLPRCTVWLSACDLRSPAGLIPWSYFLHYPNKFFTTMYCKFSYILFADDLQLFIQCPANLISSAVAHMTEDAGNVSRWANNHGWQLNPSRTRSIIFGSTPNLVFLANQQLPSVVVDNHPVEYSLSVSLISLLINVYDFFTCHSKN